MKLFLTTSKVWQLELHVWYQLIISSSIPCSFLCVASYINIVVDKDTAVSDDAGVEMMDYSKITKSLPAYAIIINNQNFDKESKNRDGSEKDVKRIKELKKVNIKVEHTLTDLTAEEMVGALKFLATQDPGSISTTGHGEGALKLLNISEEDIKSYTNIDEIRGALKNSKGFLKGFANHSCLMVFILTHGSDDGVLRGRDSTTKTTVKELSEIFNSKQCKDLKEKPKLFFIQACRGSGLDEDGDQDHDDDGTTCKFPMGSKVILI